MHPMKAWLCAAGGMLATFMLQPAAPRDWIDPDTGHRIIRLTDDAGGSTLYFHDNAFSPEGDTLMVNTPAGIAIGDVAAIGTPRGRLTLVGPGLRGRYFARRSREIYVAGRGGMPVTALNVDTRQTRTVDHARGLINADASLSVVKNGSAADPEGKYPRPPLRQAIPQLQRMFPGKSMDDLTPDQRY